jgi:glycosyltransferase involved in cell wall biosynthesis
VHGLTTSENRVNVDTAGDAAPILFVSHDAWRTGAPIVLLHFLRWLKSNTRIPFATVFRDGAGELRADFEALGPVGAWADLAGENSGTGLLRRFSRPRLAGLPSLLGGRSPSLIYSNTITNGAVLEALADTSAPVITHVHELDFWITERVDRRDLAKTRARTTRFVAASQAVHDALVRRLGIPPAAVSLVYEFVPGDQARAATSLDQLRAELAIPRGALVVGGIGTTDWRKGVDLFIQLAAVVARDCPDVPVHFVWVGGDCAGTTAAELRHDAIKSGVSSRVHLCGKQPSATSYLRLFDIFALVSREDPYPLAMLEAAQAERPIVCFADAGGAPEFVRDDAGIVVRYLDLRAMADAIWRLVDDASLRTTLGMCGARRVREHHLVEQAGPEILRIIDEVRAEWAAR